MKQIAPVAFEREELDQTLQAAHILIVEDDEETAHFLSTLLADAGYSTSVAPDGQAALKTLRLVPPDLVLMDLMMPGLDGFTVTERVRAEGLTSIPIIMLTAAHQESFKVRGFDAGADDFVEKPFSSSELLARVAVQLRRSQAIRSLEGQSTYLEQALELSSRRQAEIATSVEIERSLRNDLVRSVNTHLQSLCTIFDTEYRRQPPGPGREALMRVIPRLRGAALVYQISAALTGDVVDFGNLLRTIGSSLKGVYSPRKRLPITVDAGEIIISSQVASALAMVANELITNAFKHAFPQSRFGAITICCRYSDGTLVLEVADDGVGFDSGSARPTRGLSTVHNLAGALGGAFDIVSGESGTRATLSVPVEKCGEMAGRAA